MTVSQLIKILEKFDPDKQIGITYDRFYEDKHYVFFRELQIGEIEIDCFNQLYNHESKFPITKVLEIC